MTTDYDTSTSGGATPPSTIYDSHSQDDNRFEVFIGTKTTLYMVYTDTCLSDGPSSCDTVPLGTTVFQPNGVSYLPSTEFKSQAWPLGKRLVDSMEQVFNPYVNFGRMNSYDSEKARQRYYIYCGPCGCAIRTALEICPQRTRYYNGFTIGRAIVRVDDRIDTKCCIAGQQHEKLEALKHAMDLIDSQSSPDFGDQAKDSSNLVDRVWLEQRIYELEAEGLSMPSPEWPTESRMPELFEDLTPGVATTGNAIVVLAEAVACGRVLDGNPFFPRTFREPLKNEIYRLEPPNAESTQPKDRWTREYLGTFTPRNYHTRTDPSTRHNPVLDLRIHNS